MDKKIRELRYGEPKSWKTKSVVESYPKPMLVFNWEAGGLDSISVPISHLESKEFRDAISRKHIGITTAPITYLDYTVGRSNKIRMDAFRGVDDTMFRDFIQDVNCLFDYNPFTTIVLDPLSRMSDAVLEFELKLNANSPAQREGPRPNQDIWTLSGVKCAEVVSSLFSLNCNVVIITHVYTEQDAITGAIRTAPATIGSARSIAASLASQVFHSIVEADPKTGKPIGKIETCPKGTVKVSGARFPQDLPPVVGPTYKEIYG